MGKKVNALQADIPNSSDRTHWETGGRESTEKRKQELVHRGVQKKRPNPRVSLRFSKESSPSAIPTAAPGEREPKLEERNETTWKLCSLANGEWWSMSSVGVMANEGKKKRRRGNSTKHKRQMQGRRQKNRTHGKWRSPRWSEKKETSLAGGGGKDAQIESGNVYMEENRKRSRCPRGEKGRIGKTSKTGGTQGKEVGNQKKVVRGSREIRHINHRRRRGEKA